MIDLATRADVPRIIEMARAMHAESRYSVVPMDDARVTALIERLIDGAGAVFVHRCDGVPVGMAVVQCAEDFFSGTKTAYEYAIYAEPGHRGGLAGARLLQAYIKWAQEQGAQFLHAGITTGVNTDRSGQLYERFGLEPIGRLYMARLGGQHV